MRYDIAVEDPRYIKELATHHVGGYLKIAPEHTEEGPLSKMMKPGMGSYDRFKQLFDTYSKQAGKEQYLIPYFISAHPGTRDEDMVNSGAVAEAASIPSGSGAELLSVAARQLDDHVLHRQNPLSKIGYKSEDVVVPKGDKQRRLHKALLRYHDPKNWPLIRQALEEMGKKHLIGSRRDCGASANAGRDARSAPPEPQHAPGADQAHAYCASAFERCCGNEEERKT